MLVAAVASPASRARGFQGVEVVSKWRVNAQENAMDLQLRGKTCLVNGASRGIGQGAAKVLAAEGAWVAILARRTPLLQALADEIAASGAERPVGRVSNITGASEPQGVNVASSAKAALRVCLKSGSKPLSGRIVHLPAIDFLKKPSQKIGCIRATWDFRETLLGQVHYVVRVFSHFIISLGLQCGFGESSSRIAFEADPFPQFSVSLSRPYQYGWGPRRFCCDSHLCYVNRGK